MNWFVFWYNRQDGCFEWEETRISLHGGENSFILKFDMQSHSWKTRPWRLTRTTYKKLFHSWPYDTQVRVLYWVLDDLQKYWGYLGSYWRIKWKLLSKYDLLLDVHLWFFSPLIFCVVKHSKYVVVTCVWNEFHTHLSNPHLEGGANSVSCDVAWVWVDDTRINSTVDLIKKK